MAIADPIQDQKQEKRKEITQLYVQWDEMTLPAVKEHFFPNYANMENIGKIQ